MPVTTLAALAVMLIAVNDPYTGVWILNLARSGGESRIQTLTFEIHGDEESYRSEQVWPSGRRQVTTYVAAYDGKEYPSRTVTEESSDASGVTREDAVILRKVDEWRRERIWKQGGRIVRILRRIVSPDGKTLTSQVVDVDERGVETVTTTLVFDRQ